MRLSPWLQPGTALDGDSPAINHHNQESTSQPASAASPLLAKRGNHNLKIHVSFESSPPLSTSPHLSLHPFNPSPTPLHSLFSTPLPPLCFPRLHSPPPPTPPGPSSTLLNPSSTSLRPSRPHSIPIHPHPSGVGGGGRRTWGDVRWDSDQLLLAHPRVRRRRAGLRKTPRVAKEELREPPSAPR